MASWTYNRAGDVTALDVPGTDDLTYTYNDAGQVATMVLGGTQTTSYTYEVISGTPSIPTPRLKTVTNPQNEVTTFNYNSRGMVSDKTVHSGAKESYVYDARGRLTDVTVQTNASPPVTLSEQQYAYDAASQIIRHIMNGVHTVYTYDVAGNLTEEWFGVDLNGTPTDYTDDTWIDRDVYEFDAFGNRLEKRTYLSGALDTTDVYTYDADRRDILVSIERDGNPYLDFGHDANGNRISKYDGTDTWTYDYDVRGKLTQITYPGSGGTDSMVYNPAGTRVQRTEGSTTNNYSRAGVSVTSPLLADSGASYTPGISERRGSTTTYSHSGLKNMDTQTGSSQSVTATQRYDAWGKIRSSTGSWDNPLRERPTSRNDDL